MENYYDWTQDSRGGSASVDDRCNLCKRPVAELGGLEPGFLSGATPGPGCPEWRRADTSRQNGTGVAWRRGSFLWDKQRLCGNKWSTAAPCAQLYHSYDPASGTFLG